MKHGRVLHLVALNQSYCLLQVIENTNDIVLTSRNTAEPLVTRRGFTVATWIHTENVSRMNNGGKKKKGLFTMVFRAPTAATDALLYLAPSLKITSHEASKKSFKIFIQKVCIN